MILNKSYFFCGIGGSGMLPLALILRGHGARVAGSDRALDQGRTAAKFEFLKSRGIALFPQDGSGVTRADQTVVVSAAVEDTVPDVVAARKVGAALVTRAELLANLFNAAPQSIGVAGTSGKSTVTGMVGWMLTDLGRDPTIMNGAVMKNFASADAPFASARVGESGLFVSEVDESDGSIARYMPHIALLNNIALDHRPMAELRELFRDFVRKADVAILNLDNAEAAALLSQARRAVTYSLFNPDAGLMARNLRPEPDGIAFDLILHGGSYAVCRVQLQVPGTHNVYNALAALSVATALGLPTRDAGGALSRFTGIRRRLEVVGTANGITVIDDFAHNPDKIAASLCTLHAFPGRLLIVFQPHGYGPLRKMREEFIEAFSRDLAPADVLVMPEPVYYGGTTERSVTSEHIAEAVRRAGRNSDAFATRVECGNALLELAQPGDRMVIMGARDDTLAGFAADLLAAIEQRKKKLLA
ncbi:MAG: UDP-N-acetylmuramate--alanine ligase [Alphaproteobacteria bacterium]|nr:UDP-N-acetylmuramate--alanine ligase [Alphaproteobacteria bacterium]